MGNQQKILVNTYALGARVASLCGITFIVLCVGCGQRGPLTLPNDNDFKQRATLPDIVRRQLPELSPSPATPSPAKPDTGQADPGASTPPAKR